MWLVATILDNAGQQVPIHYFAYFGIYSLVSSYKYFLKFSFSMPCLDSTKNNCSLKIENNSTAKTTLPGTIF